MIKTGDDTTQRVKQALAANGVNVSFSFTRFVGVIDSGKECHDLVFYNEDNEEVEVSQVYLWRKGEVIVGDF